jgi:mono/diheme cytochrome c family protein
MTVKSERPSPIAPLGGVVVGIAVFLGVNITSGWAIIPTPASVKNHGRAPLPAPAYPQVAAPGATGPIGPYQAVCATCHQAEGQGMPGAFPPLAGSEWITGNPEVPIRIVLAGLQGAIDVKGTTYNALMPPPAGMTDEQIAEAITYARTHFGNTASKVDVAQVKEVRAALAGRAAPFTADELKPLLAAAAAEPAAAGAAGAAGEGAPGEAAAGGAAAPGKTP